MINECKIQLNSLKHYSLAPGYLYQCVKLENVTMIISTVKSSLCICDCLWLILITLVCDIHSPLSRVVGKLLSKNSVSQWCKISDLWHAFIEQITLKSILQIELVLFQQPLKGIQPEYFALSYLILHCSNDFYTTGQHFYFIMKYPPLVSLYSSQVSMVPK